MKLKDFLQPFDLGFYCGIIGFALLEITNKPFWEMAILIFLQIIFRKLHDKLYIIIEVEEAKKIIEPEEKV